MQRLLGSPTFRVWLALVGVATLIIGASYAMAQQSTRLSADDLPLTTLQVAKQELQNGSNFSFTDQHGTDRFTWEPESGVRAATRVTKYGKSPDDGYIITGQSLKPYEDKIATYTWIAVAAWIASIAWSYLLILLPHAQSRTR
jgi:hypothetical protein